MIETPKRRQSTSSHGPRASIATRLLLAGVAAIGSVAAGFSAGCGKGSAADPSAVPAAAKARGNTFSFVERGDIITLDINQMSYMQDFRVMYATREGLFSYSPETAKPEPALAIKTSVSDDKKTWTFTLRDDAKWTNGDPVTAADFLFSWRLMLEAPGEYTYLYYYVKNAHAYELAYRDGKPMSFDAVGLSAPDAHTIVMKLTDPVPYLEDILAFPIFYPRNERSMAAFKKADAAGHVSYDAGYTRPENVVTNGPFKFTQWQAGQKLSFAKSDSYWDAGAVKLDAVYDIINSDPQSAFVSYDQGDVDWLVDVNPDIAVSLKQQGRTDLHLSQDYGTEFLTFNCDAKSPELGDVPNPLADERVRRALAMAIDKQQIVETITRLGEKPAPYYIPPGYFEGFKSKPSPAFDVGAAKKLLADAGFAEGAKLPALSICYPTSSAVRRDLCQALAYQWKQALGITVNLRGMESKGYKDYINRMQYTIGVVAWYGDYMDPSTWTDKYLSTSLNNSTGWTPPAYDALLDRAAAEPDERKRYDLLEQAESMLNEQAPIVPLYYYVNRTMYRDNVRGITPNPRNTISWKTISVSR